MKMGKSIIATVAITICNAIIGAITCGGIFNWVCKLELELEATGVTYYIGGTVLLNFLFVLVYATFRKGIPGKNKIVKGLIFGLCVWTVGILPAMFATYTFMTVVPTVILYWLIMGLIQEPLKGLITATIYGE